MKRLQLKFTQSRRYWHNHFIQPLQIKQWRAVDIFLSGQFCSHPGTCRDIVGGQREMPRFCAGTRRGAILSDTVLAVRPHESTCSRISLI